MDLFGWLWVVVFCTLWFGVSGDSMGRKLLSDMHGASLVLFETGFWDFVIYIYGPSVPLFPSLPSLWHNLKTLGREKRLAPLWSGP